MNKVNNNTDWLQEGYLTDIMWAKLFINCQTAKLNKQTVITHTLCFPSRSSFH